METDPIFRESSRTGLGIRWMRFLRTRIRDCVWNNLSNGRHLRISSSASKVLLAYKRRMDVHGDNPEFSSEVVGPALDMLVEIGQVTAAHRPHCYGDSWSSHASSICKTAGDCPRTHIDLQSLLGAATPSPDHVLSRMETAPSQAVISTMTPFPYMSPTSNCFYCPL